MGIDEDLDGTFDADERDAGTSPSNPGSEPGACNDGTENNGDGVADLADPGCKDSGWNIENPQCNDGVNNDSDGLVDLADAQCSAAWVKSERGSSCGLGAEMAFLLPLLGAWRARRRRS